MLSFKLIISMFAKGVILSIFCQLCFWQSWLFVFLKVIYLNELNDCVETAACASRTYQPSGTSIKFLGMSNICDQFLILGICLSKYVK